LLPLILDDDLIEYDMKTTNIVLHAF
jgi:hypothetical protein